MTLTIEPSRPVNSRAHLRARDICMVYGDHVVLRGAGISLAPGSITALCGRNGSGKTTMLRILAGLLAPVSGTIELSGRPIPTSNDRWSTIGFLPQHAALDATLSVHDLLYFQARYFGLSRTAARRRSGAVMALIGLNEWAGKTVAQLSGGLQRRVAFARVIVPAPSFLLLDEPTTGFDTAAIDVLADVLLKLRAEGTAVALCTHDLAVVERVADDIVQFAEGTTSQASLAEVAGGPLHQGHSEVTLAVPLNRAALRRLHEVNIEAFDLGSDGHTLKLRTAAGSPAAAAIPLDVREFRAIPGTLADTLAWRTARPLTEEDLSA
jgi:ABC-2 type transport system ATP-binding protein